MMAMRFIGADIVPEKNSLSNNLKLGRKDKVSWCSRNGVYFTNPHLA
jgi:hypothetical protein